MTQADMEILRNNLTTYYRPCEQYGCRHDETDFLGLNCRGNPVFRCLNSKCGRIFSKPLQNEIDICPNCGFKKERVIIK